MSAEQHNEFVKQTVAEVGRRMLADGTFAEQMVMLESLIAGLFAATIVMAGRQPQADEYLSALTHGVRLRMRPLLTSKSS